MIKTPEVKSINDAARLAGYGLAAQGISLVFIFLMTVACGCSGYGPVFWNCLAGIPVWLIIFFRLRLFCREATLAAEAGDSANAKLDAVRKDQLKLTKIMIPMAEFGFCWILLLGGGITLLQSIYRPAVTNPSLLRNLVFSGVLTFIILDVAFFWNELVRKGRGRELQIGAGNIIVLAWLAGIATLGIGGAYLHFSWTEKWTLRVIASFDLLIGIEALIRIFSRMFLPLRKGEEYRPAYQSYFYGIMMSPGAGWKTFTDVLSHQFGLDISGGMFLKTAKAMLIPFLFFLVVLLFVSSSVVTLNPSEQGVILRFGRLTGRKLGPGFHLKAPWPIETARIYDTWKVNSIHVGSHRQLKGGEVYQQGMPILWTNQHGVAPDDLMVVAPPTDLMDKTGTIHHDSKSEGIRKAPSISLAAVDITVEYRINDLDKYITAGRNPDRHFRELAQQTVTFEVCRFDIDTLFCKGRIGLITLLKYQIQQLADLNELGLEIVNIGIGGVHPPQDVAAAFQETVTARQEKETSIQFARQYAVRSMIETAGSIENAQKILTAISRGEKQKAALFSESLFKAEGYVAQTLAEAYAYRWVKENQERGKSERFKSELMTYKVAPLVYLYGCYLNVLDSGLQGAEKYMLVSDRKDLILRFDMKKAASLSGASVPYNSNSSTYKPNQRISDPVMTEDYSMPNQGD